MERSRTEQESEIKDRDERVERRTWLEAVYFSLYLSVLLELTSSLSSFSLTLPSSILIPSLTALNKINSFIQFHPLSLPLFIYSNPFPSTPCFFLSLSLFLCSSLSLSIRCLSLSGSVLALFVNLLYLLSCASPCISIWLLCFSGLFPFPFPTSYIQMSSFPTSYIQTSSFPFHPCYPIPCTPPYYPAEVQQYRERQQNQLLISVKMNWEGIKRILRDTFSFREGKRGKEDGEREEKRTERERERKRGRREREKRGRRERGKEDGEREEKRTEREREEKRTEREREEKRTERENSSKGW